MQWTRGQRSEINNGWYRSVEPNKVHNNFLLGSLLAKCQLIVHIIKITVRCKIIKTSYSCKMKIWSNLQNSLEYFQLDYRIPGSERQRHLACLVKNLVVDILIFFLFLFPENRLCYFLQIVSKGKNGFGIPCKLSPKKTICKRWESLFSRINMKTISNVTCWHFCPAC